MTQKIDVSGFSRASLWSGATPFEPMSNLTDELGGGPMFVKRDDCNGLAFGGNKVRQLEYYLGDAIAKGADTVLMTGAVQSNFVRTAAAACCKLRLKCHVQLEDRVPKDDFEYNQSGNVLLDHLFGATVTTFGEGEDETAADRELERIAADYQNQGRKTYVVPMHFSHAPLGALGYFHAAEELVQQIDDANIKPDRIFVGSGSGNTHAGLLVGLRLLGNQTPVTGVCVRRSTDLQQERMEQRCAMLCDMVKKPDLLNSDDLQIDGSFLPPGYGLAGNAAQEAIVLSAQTEGILVDPVYTSKVLAGAIKFSREHKDKTSVFIHSGGGPALFGYAPQLRQLLDIDQTKDPR